MVTGIDLGDQPGTTSVVVDFDLGGQLEMTLVVNRLGS